jgi:hypothetical protein
MDTSECIAEYGYAARFLKPNATGAALMTAQYCW